MYQACQNTTDYLEFSICNPNWTDTNDAPALFDENTERFVQISVVILFGFIFVAGLIGNALVVIGK